MPTIDRETFKPRYFTKYFTKNLALACGLIAISTFNYAFDQVSSKRFIADHERRWLTHFSLDD